MSEVVVPERLAAEVEQALPTLTCAATRSVRWNRLSLVEEPCTRRAAFLMTVVCARHRSHAVRPLCSEHGGTARNEAVHHSICGGRVTVTVEAI